MLRPERMSKVSVTGSKAVMSEVIETVHDLHLVHLSDYDGSWEGFDNGTPIEGSEEVSEKLVTVRSLESILDVEEEDVGPTRALDEAELDARIEEVREEVNELDEQREKLREELREVNDRIDSMEPFARLGIDLDLLRDYDSIDVAVGHGREPELEEALEAADEVRAYETFSGDGVVAIAVLPAEGAEDAVSDALVGVEFTRLEVPDAEGSPAGYVDELRHEKQKLERKIASIESELEEIKVDVAGFLLAAEEELSVEVQQTEAPLRFATTKRSFVAEGWIPTEQYDDLVSALQATVGDRVEIEELERADYDEYGGHEEHEEAEEAEGGPSPEAEAGEEPAVADGGVVTVRDDPPVIQNNPKAAKPFETLVQAVARPRYDEFDPTVLLLLTFPAFFGFMIADVGYGILYVLIGYYMWQSFDSEGITSLGGIAMWAGGFTVFFGMLFGEFFGLHGLGHLLFQEWGGLSRPPLGSKGLEPAAETFALTWLVLAVLIGVIHLNVGFVLSFFKDLQHSLKHAVFESASWLLMLNGIWMWILSVHFADVKPAFIYTVFDGEPFALGFSGFPVAVGLLGAAMFGIGLVLLAVGEPVEIAEFLQVLVNVLSYTRITAVLLAKGGMAFVVNLLVFGVYETHGERHFMITYGPEHVASEYGSEAIMIDGLFHQGPVAFLAGILLLIVGHLLVLALGITSAGLQGIRLEYVEFFGKFYEGGGKKYEPFGYDRDHTTEN